jgi:Glycerophosphoryl diester phosphodiesterase family
MKNLTMGLAFLNMLTLFSCTQALYTNQQVSDLYKTKFDSANKFAVLTEKTKDRADEGFNSYNGINSALKNASAPLPNGFAHNDYLHEHPLYDALENGFTNIEADVFLLHGKLIVAHIFPYFKSNRTLESLYLKPLSERVAKNKGKVFAGYDSPVTLLIDIKTNATNTYKALKPLLEKYRSMLSSYENGKMVYRAVTIVLSGNKPYQSIKNEQNRVAFIDQDLYKVPCDSVSNHVFTMASCRYASLIKWNGNGSISMAERIKLRVLVAIAHKKGAKVRLWASPENKVVWDELMSCGVDLINTDQLVNLKNYFNMQIAAKVD